jgi:endonuclease YncB( thermonuclease family)
MAGRWRRGAAMAALWVGLNCAALPAQTPPEVMPPPLPGLAVSWVIAETVPAETRGALRMLPEAIAEEGWFTLRPGPPRDDLARRCPAGRAGRTACLQARMRGRAGVALLVEPIEGGRMRGICLGRAPIGPGPAREMEFNPERMVAGGRELEFGPRTALAACLLAAAGSPVVLGLPRVIDGGTLDFGGRRLALWGVAAPAPGRACGDDSGPYDCGQEAAGELGRRIRDFTVRCVVAGRRGGIEIARCAARWIECYNSGCNPRWRDIGEEMIEEGAVTQRRRESRGAYDEAEASARAGRAGLWSRAAPAAAAGRDR